MGKAKKLHCKDGIPGKVKSVKNLYTGYKVSIYVASQMVNGFADPNEGGDWCCVCEEHGGLVQFETRELAELFFTYPAWCPKCQEEFELDGEWSGW